RSAARTNTVTVTPTSTTTDCSSRRPMKRITAGPPPRRGRGRQPSRTASLREVPVLGSEVEDGVLRSRAVQRRPGLRQLSLRDGCPEHRQVLRAVVLVLLDGLQAAVGRGLRDQLVQLRVAEGAVVVAAARGEDLVAGRKVVRRVDPAAAPVGEVPAARLV